MSDLPTHREATFFHHSNHLPQKAGRSLKGGKLFWNRVATNQSSFNAIEAERKRRFSTRHPSARHTRCPDDSLDFARLRFAHRQVTIAEGG